MGYIDCTVEEDRKEYDIFEESDFVRSDCWKEEHEVY